VCPPCLRRLARPPAPKVSPARVFRQVFVGIAALVCLAALVFVLLRWRMDQSQQHLDLGNVVNDLSGRQTNE
jgi:hypothetical protein